MYIYIVVDNRIFARTSYLKIILEVKSYLAVTF